MNDVAEIRIAASTDEYSQFVKMTPADVGAAIENQNRIDAMYLIVEIQVQNFLWESILAILFENAMDLLLEPMDSSA
tara:strand:- start:2440 stop:2670 length:231 start_codon:yes stop_codon:yes gene_type:complete